MFNFSLVRMAGALKIHLHPILKSSKLMKQFFESVKFILENVKNLLFVVNKSISYLLFDDEKNMRLYLKKSFKDKLVIPRTGLDEEFMPMGAPLLDFLTVDTDIYSTHYD